MSDSIVAILGSHLRNFWGRQVPSAPQPVSVETAFQQSGWTNIYRTQNGSTLFRSVLSDPTDDESKSPVGRQPEPVKPAKQAPSGSSMKIGEQLRTRSDDAREAGEALAQLSDRRTAGYIHAVLDDLSRQSCRVAFVGQMNSGKSSLINVLTQRPDFLPTDINPWTTVVTNLHFGLPDMPEHGAVFQFFNWDEWGRLANGSPRVKELTRLLMPDFNWESFAKQVDAINRQARHRLGAKFEQLVGQRHQYDHVTKEILEQYISAGCMFDEAEDISRAGEYSSITKIADLYLDKNCFNFPTTLVDTPGVNDPFLVRDEITRQNLELADIYVVVLTARQPLSNADLSLLRLLKGLNKERLVIFVNKIDQLDTIADHAAEITRRIGDVLAKELSFTDVPIILGSAFWAKATLEEDEHEIASALTASQPLARNAPALDLAESFWLDASSLQELRADVLLTRSGIPDLAAALSDMMQRGEIPQAISGVETLMISIARNAEAVEAQNLRLTLELLAGLRSGGAREEQALRLLRDKSARIGRLKADGEARIAKLDREIASLSHASCSSMRNELRKLVASFAQTQCGEFLDRHKQRNGALWQCNTLPLRCELEAEVLDTLGVLQSGIASLEEGAAGALQAIVARASDELGLITVCGPLPFRHLSPSMAPLSAMAAVDSDSPAWRQWCLQPVPSDERVRQLRRAIEMDFGTISEQIAQSIEEEASVVAAAILDHFRIVMFAPLDHWRRELGTLVEIAAKQDAQTLLESGLAQARIRLEKFRSLLAEFQSPATGPSPVTRL